MNFFTITNIILGYTVFDYGMVGVLVTCAKVPIVSITNCYHDVIRSHVATCY